MRTKSPLKQEVPLEPKVKVRPDTPFRTESFMSYNYTQFEMGKNRKISKKHLNGIIDSIISLGFLPQFRVLVTKSGFIIDGQHRLMAAMEAKKAYYYEYCDLSTDLIALLNNLQLKWKPIDYVEYYAHSKNPNYVKLLEVIDMYKDFSYSSITAVINPFRSSEVSYEVANGSFEFPNQAAVIKLLTFLTAFSEFIPLYSKRAFVRGFVAFHKSCKGYDHDHMKAAIKKNNYKFTNGNEVGYYLNLLREIYY